MEPLFFTPIVNYFLLKSLNGEVDKHYYKGITYPITDLVEGNLSIMVPSNILSEKIKYLETRWIKILEPPNTYELVKIILLSKV